MITIDMNAVLSFAAALLGVCALLTAIFTGRSNRRWQARCQSIEHSLAAVRRELELVASISVKTGRRVKRIEQQCSGVADRVDVVEARGPAQLFDEAISSARRGADPVKLSQQFGLSRGEADLVTRLHGRQRGH
jgi:Protein of unknown function (DUF2802)